MNGAGELHFALDVDHFPFAQAGGGGDPGRLGKGEIAQFDHGQPVDLARHRPLRVDQQGVAQNRFLQLVAQPVLPANLRVDRLLHVGCAATAMAGLARPVIGLLQQIGHASHVGGQPLRIADQPRAVLDHPRHGAAVEGQQFFLARQRGDQTGIEQMGVGIALNAVFEIRRHLEQLVEIRVVLLQQVIEQAVAEQHDLDIQRHRLRLQRDGADQAVHLAQRFDANLARLQGAFQAFPGKGLHQHFAHVQQQVAAVGPVQRTRLDQGEIRHQRAQLGDMLDPPDQVAVGRVVLADDRGAGLLAVASPARSPGSGERSRG